MAENNVIIKRIVVKKLFGTYDYDLTFDELVSIMIAPNGMGKTTIFKLIKATLNPTDDLIRFLSQIPFEEFSVTLENDKTVYLYREKLAYDSRFDKVSMMSEEQITAIYNRLTEQGLNLAFKILNPDSSCFGIPSEERLSEISIANEIRFQFDPYNRGSSSQAARYLKGIEQACSDHAHMLKAADCDYYINYIPADRLHAEYSKDEDNKDGNKLTINPLSKAVSDMEEKAKECISEYSAVTSRAQNFFPIEYINEKYVDCPPYEEFKKEWDGYLNELKAFADLGFINKDNVSYFEINENDYADKKEFLCIYLSLFQETTKPLYKYHYQFYTFKDIFDERNFLTKKEIEFTPSGLKIRVNNGETLNNINSLSSGEKNDFMMFYNLIFKAKGKSLILIDEPEISLHIAWQDTFINRLIEIAEFREFQVITATHSPHVVGGHFDLVKELES